MSMRYTTSMTRDSSSQGVLKCTDLPQFDALIAQAEQYHSDDKLHLRDLCNDSARCSSLKTQLETRASRGAGIFRRMILDYSRQRITGETMELLFDLADAVGMKERREALRTGQYLKDSPDGPVLHHVLRMPADYPLRLKLPSKTATENLRRSRTSGDTPKRNRTFFAASDDDDDDSLLKQVHQARQRVKGFSEQVRSGGYRSVSGETIVNVLCVGGGSLVGPDFVAQALAADSAAAGACRGRKLRFLSSVDPVEIFRVTHDLDPHRTLVLVVSRTFSDTETMLLARAVQSWLVQKILTNDEGNETYTVSQIVTRHMIAITNNPVRSRQFGIAKENIFECLPWVSSRYSVFSVVGILPLSLHFSYDAVCRFLEGAHEMDEHFFETPLNQNIPVILGLLGVWNSTFMGFSCRATLPYCEALGGLPSFLQKMDMESNGKNVAIDGAPLLHESGEIDIGASGSKAAYTLFQLMSQGRVIPADFIGFMESQQPLDLPGEAVSNHDEFMAHFFAQPDALAYGKRMVELMQENIPESLREHMVCPGNRPSSILLMSRFDAFSLGQIVALYEHRTTIQGFLWGINSFDKLGLELGKTLSRKVRSQLSVSRKTGASVQGFNVSTSKLLEDYLSHDNDKKRLGANGATLGANHEEI